LSKDLEKLELRSTVVGPWTMNSYALVCPQSGVSVLIDPGDEPNVLLKMLSDSTPRAILLTHTHPDHIGALREMRDRLRVPLLAHRLTKNSELTPKPDRYLEDGDSVDVGHFALDVYHTPGHIEDQICFFQQNDNRVIVGDTIFEGGPGKTWSAEGFKVTLNTLRNVILQWSDETICYPGHGSHFRLGDRKPAINAFLLKDHDDFYGDATWEM